MVEIRLFELLCVFEQIRLVARRGNISGRHGYLFDILTLEAVDVKVGAVDIGAISVGTWRVARRDGLVWGRRWVCR